MNRFLTDKAKKKRWWEIPVGGFFTLLGYLTVKDAVAFYRLLRYVDVESLVLLAAMAYLIGTPLYRIIRWHVLKHRAELISERLSELDADHIPLTALDGVLGIRHAGKKIDDLIRHGFLKGLTTDGVNLITDLPEYIRKHSARPTEDAAVPKPATVPKPAAVPKPEVADPLDTIRKIRWLNDEIDDAAMSGQIDRIEAVTSSILQTVKEKPERAGEVAKFLDYYLPIALKLLESYRLMEDQPYQGTNIQTARQRIEEIMAKLVAAMEAQQDRLFSAEAMGVDAEIDALEKTMAADGLGSSQPFQR